MKREKKRIAGKQAGYTLLEYVAGASILLAVVYFGLNQMGQGLREFFVGVGSWATHQAGAIGNTDSGGSNSSQGG